MQPIEASIGADALQFLNNAGGFPEKFRFHHALQVAKRAVELPGGGTITVPEVFVKPGSEDTANVLLDAFRDQVIRQGASNVADVGEGSREEKLARLSDQVKVIEILQGKIYTRLGGHRYVHHITDGLHE